MSTESRLMEAIDQFNRAELAEFQLATGLRHLGNTGPVFLAGEVRIRGLFVDRSGGHWTDAHLVVESGYLRHPLKEFYDDRVGGGLMTAHDLRVLIPERGWTDAIVGPVAEICEVLDLPEPEPFPDGWARSWRTFPFLADAEALGLVAAGLPGDPDLMPNGGTGGA